MPHHPTPQPEQIAELARWFWPGLVKFDDQGVVQVRRLESADPQAFAPHVQPADAFLALGACRRHGLLRKVLQDFEMRLRKFHARHGRDFSGKPRLAGGISHEPIWILHPLQSWEIGYRARVDLIRFILDPGDPEVDASPHPVELWKRLLRSGIRPRLVEKPSNPGVDLLGETLGVPEDKLHGWMLALLRECYRLPDPVRKAVLLKHVFHVSDLQIGRTLLFPIKKTRAALRYGSARIQQELDFHHGVSWSGRGLDFHCTDPGGLEELPQWTQLGLAATPAAEAYHWILEHGGGETAADLMSVLLEILPQRQQELLVLRYLHGYRCIDLSERLAYPLPMLEQELALGERHALAVLQHSGVEQKLLRHIFEAMLCVIRGQKGQSRPGEAEA